MRMSSNFHIGLMRLSYHAREDRVQKLPDFHEGIGPGDERGYGAISLPRPSA